MHPTKSTQSKKEAKTGQPIRIEQEQLNKHHSLYFAHNAVLLDFISSTAPINAIQQLILARRNDEVTLTVGTKGRRLLRSARNDRFGFFADNGAQERSY